MVMDYKLEIGYMSKTVDAFYYTEKGIQKDYCVGENQKTNIEIVKKMSHIIKINSKNIIQEIKLVM